MSFQDDRVFDVMFHNDLPRLWVIMIVNDLVLVYEDLLIGLLEVKGKGVFNGHC